MSVRQKLSVAADIIHDYGCKTLLVRAVPWLLSRRYFVYCGRISAPADGRLSSLPFRLEVVRESDIGRVVGMRPALYSTKTVSERLEQGHLCFLGWLGRTPVHVRWLFTRPVFLPYLGRTIDLRAGEAYSDESYTLRRFRRLGITGRTFRLLGRRMTERGYHRFIALVAPWNTVTIRLMNSHGLKRVGECGYRIRLPSRPFFVRGSVAEENGRTIRVLEG